MTITMTTGMTVTAPAPPARRSAPLAYRGARAENDVSTSVGKALSLLNAFLGTGNTVLGVSEIARRAGVAKSTAHRLLTVLETHGLVERAGQGWLPGTHLFRLGNTVAMCRPERLRDRALPFMQDLYTETQTVVNLCVLHDTQVLYVEKLVSREPLHSPARVGGCMPVYCTAVGKAMLAHSSAELFDRVTASGMAPLTTRTITTRDGLAAELAKVRRAGFALDQQESAVGLVCVAAPILRDGRMLGALSLSLNVRRGLPQHYVPRLLRATEALAELLGPQDYEAVEISSPASNNMAHGRRAN
jgi:DNA-binding IclR family transcriptional regulator